MELDRIIGILPAAGAGSRMRTIRGPKELLPIALIPDPVTAEWRPMLAMEYSLQAMTKARVQRCLMVVNDRKPELLRYFGNGADVGLRLAYLNQPTPLGLACAIDEAYEWTLGCNVCLALPDSVFTPQDALLTVNRCLVQQACDLVLGVFPTDQSEHLGPVRFGPDGRVLEVFEKPATTDLDNTWGVAAWGPRFSRLLHDVGERLLHLSIGHVFNEAIQKGLKVHAIHFTDGSYTDLGTPQGLTSMLARFSGAVYGG